MEGGFNYILPGLEHIGGAHEGGMNIEQEQQETENQAEITATGSDDEDDAEDEENDEEEGYYANGDQKLCPDRRCDLLWQGILPKRTFTGFKFHEAKTSSQARKMLEGKAAAQYWDMVVNAEGLLKSDDIF